MTAATPIPFETEATIPGPQTVVPGVRPVSMKARLEALAAHPGTEKAAKALRHRSGSLSSGARLRDPGNDVARNQMDLFSAAKPNPTTE